MQDVETSHEKGFRIEEGAITFKNVSLRYPGASKLALDGISLDIQAGERVGICGRSGSGKTTTIGALARLLDLESGSIEIDGRDISSVSRKTLRQQITNVPQEPLLLELTLRDNLDLDGEYDDATIWNALEQCSCRDVVEKLPNKLDTHISGEGNTFSRGQRQLLALARALLRKRKILCLDESSSSLDHASDEAVQAMLRGDAFRGCTLLIVAHRTSTIRDCDRVAVWSEGRIVEIGPPQELLANASSEFRKLVEEQEGFL